MSYSLVKVNGKPVSTNHVEIIIDSSSDVSSLPTDVADGSMAYTSDLTSVYLFKSGTWVPRGD